MRESSLGKKPTPDSENIAEMRQFMKERHPEVNDSDTVQHVLRPYGSARREGMNPKEARDLMYNMSPEGQGKKLEMSKEQDVRSKVMAETPGGRPPSH